MLKYVYDNPNDIAIASNVVHGENPPFTICDFLSVYPHFANILSDETTFPPAFIEMYIQFANDCVSYKRWGNQWKLGMCLFLAHFFTIYLQSLFPENATAQEIMSYGQSKGLISSKSVGDVSVSYDFGAAVQGVESWGQFNTTAYGLQFANLAKLLGKAGMYIW